MREDHQTIAEHLGRRQGRQFVKLHRGDTLTRFSLLPFSCPGCIGGGGREIERHVDGEKVLRSVRREEWYQRGSSNWGTSSTSPAVSNSEQGTSGTRGGLTRLDLEAESAFLRSGKKITNIWTEIGPHQHLS